LAKTQCVLTGVACLNDCQPGQEILMRACNPDKLDHRATGPFTLFIQCMPMALSPFNAILMWVNASTSDLAVLPQRVDLLQRFHPVKKVSLFFKNTWIMIQVLPLRG
jgi:hypothetical protein